MQNKNFTILKIGNYTLLQPMPFIHIAAKGKQFEFQANDGTEYASTKSIKITFDHDYYLCAYQTTQEFWHEVVKLSKTKLDPDPSRYKGKTRPVEKVNWDDIQIFNEALNKLRKSGSILFEKEEAPPNLVFALPSEAQWEYAALVSSAPEKFMFSGSQNLEEVGWYDHNSNDQTKPVGMKLPNGNGLFDMAGNVWEWCQNDYDIVELNGSVGKSIEKEFKSLRGGGFFNRAQICRSRDRFIFRPDDRDGDIGFRLGFSPSSTAGEG
jgi:formylglycine-generating enzyme